MKMSIDIVVNKKEFCGMKKRQKTRNPEMSCWIHEGIGMHKCSRLDSSFCSKLYSTALITLHQYLVGIQYFLGLPGKTHHCLESSGTFMLPFLFSNYLISFDPYSKAFLSWKPSYVVLSTAF